MTTQTTTFNNRVIQFSLLFILLICCFLPIFPELYDSWMSDSDNSHCLMVPFIVAYLIYMQKHNFSTVTHGSSVWGFVILFGAMILYLVSYAGDINFIARFCFVASISGAVLICFGTQFYRLIAFPLLFLFFMVPLPDSVVLRVSFPLQLLASKISHMVIQAVSIPVLREGNMLYFAEAQLEVAEACSGIRSLVAYIMLSTLFTYLMINARIWLRMVVILSAVPLALFVNILRVTGTGILAHFFGSQVAQGFLHDFSGIVVFAFGFILLSLECRLLARVEAKLNPM